MLSFGMLKLVPTDDSFFGMNPQVYALNEHRSQLYDFHPYRPNRNKTSTFR